jgi:hypothetical protein
MKSLRLLLVAVLMSLPVAVLAQSEAHKDAHKTDAAPTAAPKSEAPKSEARKSFGMMKALAGEWEGMVKTDFPGAEKALAGAPLHVSMRVTSRGNVMVHEFQQAGTPLDPKKYDHPVTMFYVDAEQLNLVHYCDAGNRPRMIAKTSPDGKTIEFDFVDVAGSTKFGHMYHAIFTLVDENHHIEEWTFLLKTPEGDKPVQARFELQRVNSSIPGAPGAGSTTGAQ